MIRILNILPRLKRGGSQAMIMNIYRCIDRSKIQFDFLIFTKDHDDYYDEIVSLGGKVYSFEKFNSVNYFRIIKKWRYFLDEHSEYRIIYNHVYTTASIYIPDAKKRGIKTIVHSHSTSNGNGAKSVIKKILQFPLRYRADYLLACSSEAGEWLYGKKAINKSNYKIIPNAIPLKEYKFNKNYRDEIRKLYKIENKFVIGHVGGFEKPKNHKFIINVFERIANVDSDCVLLLVGDGTYEKEIKQISLDLGIYDKIIFAGLQTNIAKYLCAMDYFLFPSLWEGLPVSVVEAQANGLHCLLSDVITKDVCLTNNVEYMSLNEKIDNWVSQILHNKNHKRIGLNMNNNKKILEFDSIKAANRLIETFKTVQGQ